MKVERKIVERGWPHEVYGIPCRRIRFELEVPTEEMASVIGMSAYSRHLNANAVGGVPRGCLQMLKPWKTSHGDYWEVAIDFIQYKTPLTEFLEAIDKNGVIPIGFVDYDSPTVEALFATELVPEVTERIGKKT